MPSHEDETLARVGRESAAHVASARISCAQSKEHIRQSRDAIQRSFHLLKGSKP